MNNQSPPRVADAPGIAWRLLKSGWSARWRPRQDLLRRGLQMRDEPLWTGWEPTEAERKVMSERCIQLQTEMLVWSRGGIEELAIPFDGTLRGLIDAYRTDKDSSYHQLRYGTRGNYDNVMNRIAADYGEVPLTEVKARLVLTWHKDWSEKGAKPYMGHQAISMLRTLVNFGATILEDAECERMAGVLHKMRFPMGKPRSAILTAEHVIAIRAKAHELKRPSIALAQAFQFELMLRQRDVIGEWVPNSEPGISDVTDGNSKWLRGLKWEEIDDNLILRHVTSKRQKEIEVDLKQAPMVMEELARLDERPKKGPIVVYEKQKRPYLSYLFRFYWRQVADAAGVPKGIRNMDSRAGAISEATAAGAPLEHVRITATHSDIAMTQRYSRDSDAAQTNVMQLRAGSRNKK